MADKTAFRKRNIIELFVDSLFWVGLFCVLCSDLFEEVCFQNIISGGIVRKVGIICIVLKLLTDKSFLTLCLKDKCIQVFSIIFGLATYMATKDSTFFVLVIIIVAANGINYDNIGKMYIVILCITFFINIFLVMLGIKNNTFIQASSGHFLQEQADLGFIHPNRALSIYLNLLICLIITFKDRLTNVLYILYFIGGIILFYFTDSRAPMLAITVVLMLVFLRNTKIKFFLCKYHISQIVFIVSIVTMVCLGFIFNGDRIIDEPFTSTFISRVMTWRKCVESLGFSLFGVGSELSYPVDCAFYRILFRFGICGAVIYILLFSKAFINNKNNYYFNIAMLGLCVISVFESRIVYIQYILPLISVFADNNMLKYDISIEISKSDKFSLVNLEKFINYVICFCVGGLLIGHAFFQHYMEKIELAGGKYVGISTRFTDIIFMLVCSMAGVFIYIIYK